MNASQPWLLAAAGSVANVYIVFVHKPRLMFVSRTVLGIIHLHSDVVFVTIALALDGDVERRDLVDIHAINTNACESRYFLRCTEADVGVLVFNESNNSLSGVRTSTGDDVIRCALCILKHSAVEHFSELLIR